MENILNQILDGQKQLFNEIKSIRSEIATKEELSMVKENISNIKGQLDETNQLTRSLLHRTEELDAKFDGLLHNTASKDTITHLETKMERIAGDINFLVRKAAEHEDDIRNLRLIK